LQPAGRELGGSPRRLHTLAVLALLGLALSVRIVQQYEKGVLFRLGRVIGVREPGLTLIVPIIDTLRRGSLPIITMPIQSHNGTSVGHGAMPLPRFRDQPHLSRQRVNPARTVFAPSRRWGGPAPRVTDREAGFSRLQRCASTSDGLARTTLRRNGSGCRQGRHAAPGHRGGRSGGPPGGRSAYSSPGLA
jgi:hypothetical protein